MSLKSNKLFKNAIICFSVIIIIIINILTCIRIKHDDEARMYIENLISIDNDISEYISYAIAKTDNGNCYNEKGKNSAVREMSRTVSLVSDYYIEEVDKYYPKSKTTINKIIKKETIYDTWEDYRQYLYLAYYIDEDLTDQERIEKMIQYYVDHHVY